MHYIVALLSVVLGAVGQYFFKIGVDQIKLASGNILLTGIKNPAIWTGLFSYGMSVLLWFYVLSQMELSKAYPLVSLGYVITLFLGYFFLNEPITLTKSIGILLIMTGVFFLTR